MVRAIGVRKSFGTFVALNGVAPDDTVRSVGGSTRTQPPSASLAA